MSSPPSTTLRDHLQRAVGSAFTIERELGGGGMARVFAATETGLGRKVAIKVLEVETTEGFSAERFAREVRTAASLQQANIVPLLAAGDAGGYPYYTMPLVEGSSLRARLSSGVALPFSEAVSILKDVARALAYAHAHGIVHRDIKPENVLLSGGTAVVTDFGIAKAVDAAWIGAETTTITRPGSSLGTPGYMAPEQVAGDRIEPQTDLYAWGVLAWELLCGKHPFADRTGSKAVMMAHLAELPPPVEAHATDVPDELCALVMRCLEKDLQNRPASAGEVLAGLDAAVTPASRSGASARRRGRIVGISVPIPLVATLGAALLVVTLAVWRPWQGTVAAGDESPGGSVAVLPFENVGGDSLQEYFADGMTDELATALGRVPGFRVAARSAAYRYKQQRGVDLRQVGSALGVQYVLTGSVRRTVNQLRISAYLTRTSDGIEVWSDSYDPSAANLLAAQDSLTSAIADTLAVRFGARPARRATGTLVRRGTTDADAYDLYLKANHALNRRRPGLEGAVALYESAIARDPTFARAYAGMANALALLTYFGTEHIDQQRIIQVANRALELDPALGDAEVALGIMQMSVGRYAEAELALRRAIALEPGNAGAHFQLGRTLVYERRLPEAVEEFERAKVLEPYHPPTACWLAYAMIWTATPERALAEATRAWELDSLSAVVQLFTALTALEAGAPELSRRAIEFSQRSSFNRGGFAYIEAALGSPAEAREVVATLEARGSREWNDHINLAYASLGLGDTTRAMAAIERSFQRGESIAGFWPLWSRVFDSVRGSARYTRLVTSLGLDSTGAMRPRGQ